MEELITALLLWIGSNTTYKVHDIPQPEVRLLGPQELTDEYYSGTDAHRPESGIDSRIYALYNQVDSVNGIIYLLDPRLNDELKTEFQNTFKSVSDRSKPLQSEWYEHPVFQEQLLHELIHHVQYQSGAVDQFPCPAHGELEAYLLGGKYLKLRYATDPLPNRKVLAFIYSRC